MTKSEMLDTIQEMGDNCISLKTLFWVIKAKMCLEVLDSNIEDFSITYTSDTKLDFIVLLGTDDKLLHIPITMTPKKRKKPISNPKYDRAMQGI